MGKAALALVLAAAVGGSLLLTASGTVALESAQNTRGVQADVLARELAASAHRLVVGESLTPDGFNTVQPFGSLDFDGGHVDLTRFDASSDSLAFELTAFHSGAAHRVGSIYTWAENDFPGPLWVDAPYLSSSIDPNALISGGADSRSSLLDRRKFFDLRLESLLSFDRMRDSLNLQLLNASGPGGHLIVPADFDGLLRDYHAPTLDALYFDALDAIDGQDYVAASALTMTGTLEVGSPAHPRIVHVQGPLTLTSGAVLEGNGLLLVEGALDVQAGAEIDWDGLILVRTEDDYLPVRLDGDLTVDGAILIDQQGAPPGGHMDLTIMRDHSGTWAAAKGVETQTSPIRPWHRHTHKFDIKTGGRTVYFLEGGNPGRHDTGSYHRTRFYSTLDFLGDTPIVLELANADMHGMARFELGLDGEALQSGAVRYGFGDFAGDGPFRTQPFAASDLETLIVRIRSLRLLSYKPNNQNCGAHLLSIECDDRPQGVGGHFDRDGALTVRVRRAADDVLLYEASMYWHWKQSEAAADAEEEEAWRRRIENGEAFGTRLTMSDGLRLTFDLAAIQPIGRRLGFLGAELAHRGTWTGHWSPGDAGMPTPSD